MFKALFSVFLLLNIFLYSGLSSATSALSERFNCQNVNDNLALIEQLENQGTFRYSKPLPTELKFNFKSNAPYSEYLRFARDKIILQNPKAEIFCPIETATSKLLYPNMDLSLQLVVDLLAPFELKPENAKTGVLLIHGLTDSPFYFHDIAEKLYRQGIAVRTLMLPGHGTAPSDLLEIDEKQWRHAARYAVKQMLNDFEQVYLGGFSTGAALILDQIGNAQYDDAELAKIKGMLMWAPASKAKSDFAWAAGYVDFLPFMDWINTGADIDFAKYESFPFNAAAQVHDLMNRINGEDRKLKHYADIPIFIVASEVDQTIDTKSTIKILNKWHNASNRNTANQDTLVFYGKERFVKGVSDGIKVLIPKCQNGQVCDKVLDVSHNAATNSPRNPHYGIQGNYKYCEHHWGDEAYSACKTMAVAPIGEITSKNLDNNPFVRRLTFNPYFDHMIDSMQTFINETRQ